MEFDQAGEENEEGENESKAEMISVDMTDDGEEAKPPRSILRDGDKEDGVTSDQHVRLEVISEKDTNSVEGMSRCNSMLHRHIAHRLPSLHMLILDTDKRLSVEEPSNGIHKSFPATDCMRYGRGDT